MHTKSKEQKKRKTPIQPKEQTRAKNVPVVTISTFRNSTLKTEGRFRKPSDVEHAL